MSLSPALEASPFGRIAVELRLKIWEYALYREDAIQVNLDTEQKHPTKEDDCNEDDSSSSSLPLPPSRTMSGLELNVYTSDDTLVEMKKSPSILSLSQTCKQILAETMPVFLSINSFHARCPIFDNSKGHGEISPDCVQNHQLRLQTWLQTLDTYSDESLSSRIKSLTLTLGLWRICACPSSSQSFLAALSAFSKTLPLLLQGPHNRALKFRFSVQWRAICPCCESETDDESVWPLEFELERGRNDRFFEAVMEVCEGRAKWILNREGLCGRTRMGWLVQLERASGRLVDVWRGLGEWERGCEDEDEDGEGEEDGDEEEEGEGKGQAEV